MGPTAEGRKSRRVVYRKCNPQNGCRDGNFGDPGGKALRPHVLTSVTASWTMRHYLTLPLLLISSQYIFAALSPPKLPAFRFGANKNADEDDYDDEDDWDDEEWEDEGMSLALKSAVGAAIVTGAGIATKWFMNRKKGKTVKGAEVQKVQKTHSALAVDPYSPLMSMIDGHMLHRDESGKITALFQSRTDGNDEYLPATHHDIVGFLSSSDKRFIFTSDVCLNEIIISSNKSSTFTMLIN